MRDGRLIRAVLADSYTLVDGVLLATRVRKNIAYTRLGDKGRYKDFGTDAIEERDSIGQFDKFASNTR